MASMKEVRALINIGGEKSPTVLTLVCLRVHCWGGKGAQEAGAQKKKWLLDSANEGGGKSLKSISQHLSVHKFPLSCLVLALAK